MSREISYLKLSGGENGRQSNLILLKQGKDHSVVLNQETYSLKLLEEIEIDKTKARKTPLTASEVSQLRGALGL